jgi:hypothetical protein
LNFLPFISQRGNRGQQVVFDSAGKIHNVIRPAVGPNGKILLRDRAGPVAAMAATGTTLREAIHGRRRDLPLAAGPAISAAMLFSCPRTPP